MYAIGVARSDFLGPSGQLGPFSSPAVVTLAGGAPRAGAEVG
jgi:hypothetical protein